MTRIISHVLFGIIITTKYCGWFRKDGK